MGKISSTATVIFIFSIVTLSAGILFRHNLARVWAASQPRTQPFVQLAFTNPNELPQTIAPGKPYAFGFWAKSNHQSHPYYYEVFIEGAKGKEMISSGQLALEAGMPTTQEMALVPSEVENRQRIVVTLPELGQSIQFWVNGAAR